MLKNKDLNTFFDKEIKFSKRKRSNAKIFVLAIVNKLLQFINEEDPRFSECAIGVGSSFQGLKTKAPDEFDFNIELAALGEFYKTKKKKVRYYGFSKPIDTDSLHWIPPDIDVMTSELPLPDPPIGYGTFQYEGTVDIWKNSSDLVFDGDIIPYLVQKKLKELLLKAIRELHLPGEVHLGRKVHGPALTVKIPYNKDGMDEISIDFAAAIPNAGTLDGETTWPPLQAKWPPRDKVCRIMAVPLCAIARNPFDWLFSFTHCEEILLDDIDSDGGCRKKALRIIKRFREMYWCKTSKPVLTSYHLKNILFLECEQYTRPVDWSKSKLRRRIKSMTERLLVYIKEERLPQYFNKRVNLLTLPSHEDKETLALERQNIEKFHEDPAYTFLEE